MSIHDDRAFIRGLNRDLSMEWEEPTQTPMQFIRSLSRVLDDPIEGFMPWDELPEFDVLFPADPPEFRCVA